MPFCAQLFGEPQNNKIPHAPLSCICPVWANLLCCANSFDWQTFAEGLKNSPMYVREVLICMCQSMSSRAPCGCAWCVLMVLTAHQLKPDSPLRPVRWCGALCMPDPWFFLDLQQLRSSQDLHYFHPTECPAFMATVKRKHSDSKFLRF